MSHCVSVCVRYDVLTQTNVTVAVNMRMKWSRMLKDNLIIGETIAFIRDWRDD